MKVTTGVSEQVIGRRRSQYCIPLFESARQLWRTAVVIICALAALTAGIAQALPVSLAGSINTTPSTDCSPWCGGSDAQANIISFGGSITDGQFQGGGAAATSAILGGGGFFGKTAAATASLEWWAYVHPALGAGSDPFNLFFDWDTQLMASHDKLFGQAAGGSELEVTWYECVPIYIPVSGCFPIPVFQQKRVYTGSIVAGEQWDLGLFNQSDPYGILHITFDVGSAAATTPWVGVYASAIDVGIFDFTLRADDGRTQPVPEPPVLPMVFAALALVIGLKRRQQNRPE